MRIPSASLGCQRWAILLSPSSAALARFRVDGEERCHRNGCSPVADLVLFESASGRYVS